MTRSTLVRVRPFCRVHGEHATYVWRCFCEVGSVAPCRCEENGVWLCMWTPHEMPKDNEVMLYAG